PAGRRRGRPWRTLQSCVGGPSLVASFALVKTYLAKLQVGRYDRSAGRLEPLQQGDGVVAEGVDGVAALLDDQGGPAGRGQGAPDAPEAPGGHGEGADGVALEGVEAGRDD